MSPDKGSSRLNDFLLSALQNPSQDVEIHRLREADDVQRGFDLAAHGIDITQRIGRHDLTEQVRVLHHRREEIEGLYDRKILADLVNRRIVVSVVPHQKIRILRPLRQPLQHMGQKSRPELCRTTAAFAVEFSIIHLVHQMSPLFPQSILFCRPGAEDPAPHRLPSASPSYHTD